MKIDRTGTFKGYPVEYGVGGTKNGFPQFVVKLQATEYYDDTDHEWVDWSEVAENETVAYLVLFGGDKQATLTAKQVQKVFGWSGESFEELNRSDYSKVQLQFRIGTNTYNGDTRLQVEWIDEADVEPGQIIRKSSEKEVKGFDATYAHGLRKLSGGKTVTPTKSPTLTKPSIPSKKKIEKPEAPKEIEKPEAPKKTTGKTAKSTKKSCTKEEAWEMACDAKHESVSNEQLEEIWNTTISDLGDEDSFKKEDWYRVSKIVSTKVQDDIPF